MLSTIYCFSTTNQHVDLDAVSIHGDDELDDIDKEIKSISESDSKPSASSKDTPVTKSTTDSKSSATKTTPASKTTPSAKSTNTKKGRFQNRKFSANWRTKAVFNADIKV